MTEERSERDRRRMGRIEERRRKKLQGWGKDGENWGKEKDGIKVLGEKNGENGGKEEEGVFKMGIGWWE
jgi:hypothetical protein